MPASIVLFLKGFHIENYQAIVKELNSLLGSLKETMKNLEIEDLNHPSENSPNPQPPSPVKFQRNKMYDTMILEEPQENQQIQALPIYQSSPYIGFQLSGDDLSHVITALKNRVMQLFFCGTQLKTQGTLFHFDEPITLGLFSSSFSVKSVTKLGSDGPAVENSKEQTFSDPRNAFDSLRKLLTNQDPHDNHLQDYIQNESSEIIFQNTPLHNLLSAKESDKDDLAHSLMDISSNKDNNNDNYDDLNHNPFNDLSVKKQHSHNNDESNQSQQGQPIQQEQHTQSESIQEQSTKIDQSDLFFAEFDSENQPFSSSISNVGNVQEEQQSLRQSIRRADSVYLDLPLRKKRKTNSDQELTKKFYDYEDNEDNHSLTTNKENDNEDGSGNNLLLIGVIINFFVMLILYFK